MWAALRLGVARTRARALAGAAACGAARLTSARAAAADERGGRGAALSRPVADAGRQRLAKLTRLCADCKQLNVKKTGSMYVAAGTESGPSGWYCSAHARERGGGVRDAIHYCRSCYSEAEARVSKSAVQPRRAGAPALSKEALAGAKSGTMEVAGFPGKYCLAHAKQLGSSWVNACAVFCPECSRAPPPGKGLPAAPRLTVGNYEVPGLPSRYCAEHAVQLGGGRLWRAMYCDACWDAVLARIGGGDSAPDVEFTRDLFLANPKYKEVVPPGQGNSKGRKRKLCALHADALAGRKLDDGRFCRACWEAARAPGEARPRLEAFARVCRGTLRLAAFPGSRFCTMHAKELGWVAGAAAEEPPPLGKRNHVRVTAALAAASTAHATASAPAAAAEPAEPAEPSRPVKG